MGRRIAWSSARIALRSGAGRSCIAVMPRFSPVMISTYLSPAVSGLYILSSS